jgi:hypothetical protein
MKLRATTRNRPKSGRASGRSHSRYRKAAAQALAARGTAAALDGCGLYVVKGRLMAAFVVQDLGLSAILAHRDFDRDVGQPCMPAAQFLPDLICRARVPD